MKAWIEGGLWGLGIVIFDFIFYLEFCVFEIDLTFSGLCRIFDYYLISLVYLAIILLGVLIGWIIGKNKSKKEKVKSRNKGK